MSVVVSIEETAPCQRKLTIEVPGPAVEAEIGRVVSEYRREAKLPGFRKGKVPEKIIRQRFEREIEQEVVERLVPRYWRQAQAEKNIDPLLPPQFQDLDLADGKPMTFVASVETRPEIEIGELPEFQLPQIEVEPIEEEIDEALNDLRRRLAEWVPVDRPAARGDLVEGDSVRIDPEAEEMEEPTPIRLELGAEGVDEETTLTLTGLTAGQKAELTRRIGEGEETEQRRYRIEVKAVSERDLPELDDAFASRVGDFGRVDELRGAVIENLRSQKEREQQRQRETALLDQLRERYPIALPAGVVENETEHLLREYAQGLSMHGVDVEKANLDWERMAQDMKPQAEKRVHARLVLDAVAKALELRLDEQEFERFLAGLAAQRQQSTFALRQQLSENGRIEGLRQQLLREQTIRHLLGSDPVAEDEETPAASGA